MAKVDPYVVDFPQEWLNNPDIEPWARYTNRFLHDLWVRTGGGNDVIENIDNSEVYNTGSVSNAMDSIATLEQIEDLIPTVIPTVFYSAIKTGSYTAVNGDFIEAQSGAIITLDPEAEIDDEIMVANGDGSKITVSGTIKYTKLDTALFIRQQGTSLHFQNFGDYWRIR